MALVQESIFLNSKQEINLVVFNTPCFPVDISIFPSSFHSGLSIIQPLPQENPSNEKRIKENNNSYINPIM